MLYFPQLSGRAMGQYPLSRRRAPRTVVNVCGDGSTVRLADTDAARIEWELTYRGLTQAEWETLSGFVAAAEGRLKEFTFLDPCGNLLGWSEDLLGAGWTADPHLSFQSGVTDPLGTTRATRITNTGQAEERIMQTVDAAGWFTYCLSAYVRSSTPGSVKLVRACGTQSEEETVHTWAAWSHRYSSGNLGVEEDHVSFGLAIAPGAAVEVFGMQVEAQWSPSPYKKTAGRGGVYGQARLGEDRVRVVAEGPGQYSCKLRVESRAEL